MDGLAYNRQKRNLAGSLAEFLAVNHGTGYWTEGISLASAAPEDVIKFLIDRDAKGRTQVHKMGCLNLGRQGSWSCGCARRLAAGTVDSYLGQLRASFNSIGRTQPWSQESRDGNPCISPRVRKYLQGIRLEQAEAHVTPRQAVPLFSDKIRWLACEIQKRILSSTSAAGQNFIDVLVLYRDLAFFLCLWWAGDRAADLGRTKSCEVTRLEGGDLLFNHTIGKTVREGDIIIIPKLDADEMDPVGAVDKLVRVAEEGGCELSDGYLFRPATPDRRSLANKPFTGSAPSNRMKLYFRESPDPSDRQLRPHGGRAGVAATLKVLGATDQQVMDHCRWATHRTFKHYTQLEKVGRRHSTVRMLRDAVGTKENGRASAADLAGNFYRSLNSGLRAGTAFPRNV